MKKFAFALAIVSLGAVPSIVHGAAIDTLTLMQTGANTAFAIKGTFPVDFPGRFFHPGSGRGR